MKGLITMDDLTNEDIHSILADAERLLPVARGESYFPLLQGKILGNLFFEPSTRTRMSFETAMKRLGGDVVNLGDVKTSSVVKGEHSSIRFRWLMDTRTSSLCAIRVKVQHATLKMLRESPSSMEAMEQATTRRKPCSICSRFSNRTARLRD